MFISDVIGSSKEELHNVIIYDLRHFGVKHRIKKSVCKNSQVRCQLQTLGCDIALHFESRISY
jgi:hypothetical protein